MLLVLKKLLVYWIKLSLIGWLNPAHQAYNISKATWHFENDAVFYRGCNLKEIISYTFQLKYLALIPIYYLKVKFTLGEKKEQDLSNYPTYKTKS